MSSGSGIPASLQHDLRQAMGIELTTIPAYLYAYWSIKPLADGGSEAGREAGVTIMSVVTEEMLHMGLVSNVLNALGGTPALNRPRFVPSYPARLFDAFDVVLRPLSRAALATFLRIELPEHGDVPTIGAFYEGIEKELRGCPDTAFGHGRQFPLQDNPGAGSLIAVSSRASALAALEIIVEQGEGLDHQTAEDGDHELAHFFKFKAVERTVDFGFLNLGADVYPVIDDPNGRLGDYTPEQRRANDVFNSVYSELLDTLQETMSGASPEVFYRATGLMDRLAQLAAVLRRTGPVPGTGELPGTGTLPGPTFDYLPPAKRRAT